MKTIEAYLEEVEKRGTFEAADNAFNKGGYKVSGESFLFYNGFYAGISHADIPKLTAALRVCLQAMESLSVGHGVPLAAAIAAPPERYRIMAKELNEMLQERTVFTREALQQVTEILTKGDK